MKVNLEAKFVVGLAMGFGTAGSKRIIVFFQYFFTVT